MSHPHAVLVWRLDLFHNTSCWKTTQGKLGNSVVSSAYINAASERESSHVLLNSTQCVHTRDGQILFQCLSVSCFPNLKSGLPHFHISLDSPAFKQPLLGVDNFATSTCQMQLDDEISSNKKTWHKHPPAEKALCWVSLWVTALHRGKYGAVVLCILVLCILTVSHSLKSQAEAFWSHDPWDCRGLGYMTL